MTLVVARETNGRIAIAADTLISESGMPLPMNKWALKSLCLPGGVCVSYAGSPDLAAKAFRQFCAAHPHGTNFAKTVAYFENSSAVTNNDYIIAFATTPKLVTIRNGRRENRLSKTHWIGDKDAYERFLGRETRHDRKHEQDAVKAVLFADEMTGSPASDLYAAMREVVQDTSVPWVGGFVTVLSNRDIGFRYSVYSDVLFDWPAELDLNQSLGLTDKIDLQNSGENDRYSVSQISPGYYNMNVVAFYVLKGRLLIVFRAKDDGTTECIAFPSVEPGQIASALDHRLGFSFRALCLVMSGRAEFSSPIPRTEPDHGLGMSLFCEANTMPKIPPQK